MTAVLPTVGLNADNLPTFMQKQLGIQLKGDMALHISASIPLKSSEVLVAATTTTLAQNAGFSAPDVVTISSVLTIKKIHK